VPAQQLRDRTTLRGQADQQVLGGDVVVLELLGAVGRGVEHHQQRA
jgi:hypothetical protein